MKGYDIVQILSFGRFYLALHLVLEFQAASHLVPHNLQCSVFSLIAFYLIVCLADTKSVVTIIYQCWFCTSKSKN